MNADLQEQDVDVAIIGAGVSGLVSAYHLQSKNAQLSTVVLEAKGAVVFYEDRVGGRVFSMKIPAADGTDEWDMGGQWVSSSQHFIMKLLREFDIEVYSQYVEGKSKICVRSLSDIRSYSGLIPNLGIFELLDMNRILNKLENMASQLKTDDPLSCKHGCEWDSQTVRTFVEKESTCAATRDGIDVITRIIGGAETNQLSLFFLIYMSALSGGFNSLLDTCKGAAQEFRVKGTVYGFVKKLEEKIGKNKVMCGDPVISIDQSGGSTVVLKTLKGRVYRAKHVVCATPPHLVNQIHFNPPLPFNRQQLGQRMPVGTLIKCLCVYRTPFWRKNGMSGQAVMFSQQLTEGPLSATFDATTSNGTPAILGFIAGEHAMIWSQKTKDERKEAILKCYVALFGKEARSELVTYEDKDWSQESYNGGCPVSLMQPGCMIYFEHALREPFNRVHWAGTETARRWMGYIDGAVEAGLRAADEILGRMQSQNLGYCSKIATPSAIFCNVVEKPKSNRRKVFGSLLLAAAVGGLGYYWYKKYA